MMNIENRQAGVEVGDIVLTPHELDYFADCVSAWCSGSFIAARGSAMEIISLSIRMSQKASSKSPPPGESAIRQTVA
jgi:hypothetical protein